MARDNGQALGASGQLTSLVAADGSTGGFVKDSDLGTNVAAFLATPSSANLAAALTDELGSGVTPFVTAKTAWTPVISVATPGDISIAYSTQYGGYEVIGDLVYAWFNLVTSTWTWTTASGSVTITGLPFVAATDANAVFSGQLTLSGYTQANYTNFVAEVRSAEQFVRPIVSGSAQTAGNAAVSAFPTGGTVTIKGSVLYRK